MAEDSKPGVALITGASGFVGGRLRDALLDDGYDVVALTRPGSPEPKRGRAAPVDYHDPATLERVIERERPEYVFHVAGVTKGVHYDEYHRGNVTPTANLLDAVRRVHPGVGRFVHISSLTAYGPSQPDAPKREHDPRQPIEHYGTSKLRAEETVEAAGGDVAWTMIRPCAVYGPRDVDHYELFKLAHRRLNVFYGNRETMMSFVYIDDLVQAIRQAAAHPNTRGKGYFICDGSPVTWDQFQSDIVQASGRRAMDLNLPGFLLDVSAWAGELMTRVDGKPRLFNRQKAKLGKQVAWTCRHDAAREDFGYRPATPLADGIAQTMDWYRREGWL